MTTIETYRNFPLYVAKAHNYGEGTIVHPTAIIGPNVRIGKNCYIGPHCIIGFPPEWKGREGDYKGVIIGDDVIIAGLVTIDSGCDRITLIGNGCYLMKHCHVGHDAHVLDGAILSPGAKVGGHCEIGKDTNLGMNCCIHQKVNVPYNCMIGMGAIVTKKTVMQPGYKYAGNPARELGPNIKNQKP